VDRFLQDEERKSLPLNEHLTKLLNILDVAQSLKLGMTRAKRVKIVKYVLISLWRNFSIVRVLELKLHQSGEGLLLNRVDLRLRGGESRARRNQPSKVS
jgi:hypothetical protein